MSMLLGTKRKGRHRGGRPKAGLEYDNSGSVKHHILVDDEFWAMIEVERKPEETNNDCLWRIFRNRTEQINNLRKKVDALEFQVCQEEQTRAPEVIRL